MSSLTPIEQRDFERLFGMASGYVLDFSDQSFSEFFRVTLGLNIDDDKYWVYGASKAKRLRAFWKIEPDGVVGRALGALAHYAETDDQQPAPEPALLARCRSATSRLLAGSTGLAPLKEAIQVLDSAYLEKQISRMEDAVREDPALAIGTAKELIESISKTILKERGNRQSTKLELLPLAKLVLEELEAAKRLDPGSAKGSEKVRRTLANLVSMVQGVAELRNHYGAGHGTEGGTGEVDPVLAVLAAGAAATFCRVVLSLHKARPVDASWFRPWGVGQSDPA